MESSNLHSDSALQEVIGKSPEEIKEEADEIVALTRQLTALKNKYTNLEKKSLLLTRHLEECKGQMDRDKVKIEKMAGTLFEKEQRIAELQQIDIGLRRTLEGKQDLEKSLEHKSHEWDRLKGQNERLAAESKERSLHVEQLERVIQFLRERLQEAQLELAQLRDEYQSSQESLLQLQDQLRSSQSQSDHFHDTLKNIENEKAEVVEEVTLLHAQLEKLKSQYESLLRENQAQRSRFEALEIESGLKTKENSELKQQVQEKIASIASFEKEIHLIKQTLVRALREAKEIESQYKETLQEKVIAITKIHHHQQQIERFRENENNYKTEVQKLREKLANLETAQQEAQIQIKQKGQNYSQELETVRSSLLEKEHNLNTLQTQLHQKIEEIHILKNNLTHYQEKQIETESELRTAHQHMTKKVKEIALAEDKNHSLQLQIEEMEKIHIQDQIKVAELQTALELQKQQQSRLETHYEERLKSAEALQYKWEEKYITAHESWQKTEMKLKELEKTEERYKQLHNLVSNLGSLVSPNSSPSFEKEITPPRETVTIEPPKLSPAPTTPQREEKTDLAKPYQNLFDMPKSAGKYKQNLIE